MPVRRLVLAVGLALGAVAEWAVLRRAPLTAPPSGSDVTLAVADFTTGAVLLVCGNLARGRIGTLFTATGIAWFLGTFADATDDRVAAVGTALVALHRGPLVHALVSYPEGRLRDRIELAAVAAGWVLAVGGVQASAALVALAATVAAIAVRSAARARGALRPARRAALAASLLYAAALTASALAERERTLVWVYDAVVALAAAGLTADLRGGRWSQAAATGVVVELGAAGDAQAVRDALAAALGDRGLRLGVWNENERAFVEPAGTRLEHPVTVVREEGRPVAALMHDAELADDPELHAAVIRAVRLAVANLGLRQEIRAHVDELEASRRRLVVAADMQRAQLERRIREGAVARLAAVRELVAGAPDADPELLAATVAELDTAAGELSELARGLRPRVLTERGLAGALTELRPDAQVELGAARYPDAVEAAAYFVCAEALANAGKHAPAARAWVTASDGGGTLLVSVRDDGPGGASIDAGSGLQGLADRVGALGGRLTVASPRGGGTRVTAELPLNRSSATGAARRGTPSSDRRAPGP